ncbi:hypothetical protein H2200_009423 [Cladophialophora chaetospira]|uniref:C6 transcription factor n=1 Tax=Cladophialophora chaetospira TaxID=386627 RepID=A0AA38X439_9EURO|nr:hypothetical protein H2200_009423 [Cladophialophora chaetospira]
MGSGMGQEISKGPAFRLALEKPYLMHAINGVAADHLCHLLPQAQHPVQHCQSQLASVYHWQRAFELVREELSTRVTRDNMDALMSSIMLIGVHQFMLAGTTPDPSKSFIYAPVHQREDGLNWLQINRGFTAMQAALGTSMRESVWFPVLVDSDIKEQSAKIMNPEAGDDTHALFIDFCEVTPASSPKNNAYYDALQCLLFLRMLKPSINNFNKLITFIGVIENEFLRLLIERERRALLILAHWLGLMSELKQWWHSSRCKSECLAITTFLMHDPDERVRMLLRYPARTVGIVLTHAEE